MLVEGTHHAIVTCPPYLETYSDNLLDDWELEHKKHSKAHIVALTMEGCRSSRAVGLLDAVLAAVLILST